MISQNHCIDKSAHKWSGSSPVRCIICNLFKDEMIGSWILPFEGVDLLLARGIWISKGDLYLAGKRGDWKILTCKTHDELNGFIINEEGQYPYDTSDCWKIIAIVESVR